MLGYDFKVFGVNYGGQDQLLYLSDFNSSAEDVEQTLAAAKHHTSRDVEICGGRKWRTEIYARPIFYETLGANQPLIVGLFGLVIDALIFFAFVTLARSQRRAVENHEHSSIELKEARARLELALDSAQMGVWERDLKTGKLIWDDRVAKMFQSDAGQISTKEEVTLQRFHPEDREKIFENDARAIAEQKPITHVYRIILDDGSIRYIKSTTSAVRDENGEAIRLIGLNYDVTEQEENEQQLRITTKAVDAATIGVVITTANKDRRITYVNPAFEKISGYSADYAIGKNCRFLSEGSRDQEDLKLLKNALEAWQPITVTLRNKRKDGSPFWNRLSVSPVYDENEWVTHWIGIQEDITIEKLQSEQLEQAMGQAQAMAFDAESASRAKSAFLATMSHEIRTPMNAVIGMSTLLANSPLTSDQQEYVSTIRSSGDSLLLLINDILDFSKIEAGELNIESVVFETLPVFYETINMVAAKASQAAVELSYTLPPELPSTLIGDPNRLRQILINLLSNAVKFTHFGGVAMEVDLSRPIFQPGDSKVIHNLRIRVTDTGVGISEKALERLFEPFTQADSTTTRKYGGTGLGLAISRKLAQAMGGDIDAASVEGVGSTFTLTIPILGERDVPIAYEKFDHADLRGKTFSFDNCQPNNEVFVANALQNWGMLQHEGGNEAPDVLFAEISNSHDDDSVKCRVDSLAVPEKSVLLVPDAHSFSCIEDTLNTLTKPIRISSLHRAVGNAINRNVGKSSERRVISKDFEKEPDAEHVSLKILIAEDNRVNQRVLQQMLKRFDLEAEIANDGAEAVKKSAIQAYDLIFMEVQMPVLSGIEATQRIREQSTSPSRGAWITALTANATSEDSKECIAAGMDSFMSKPIVLDRLKENIEAATQRVTAEGASELI